MAVIGSVAASLYTSRLTRAAAHRPASPRLTAAQGSVGGAAIAAQHLAEAGLTGAAHALHDASVLAFMHSLTGACLVAVGVAAAGILLVAFLLPNRPRAQETKAVQETRAQPASGVRPQPADDQAGVQYADERATVPRAAAAQNGETGTERPLSS